MLNADQSFTNAETATFYAQAKPPHGSVFSTDLPGSAFLASGSGLHNGAAQNASLEFTTCLFKTADLPAKTTPEGAGVVQSKALWCALWNHRYVWNFETGRMDQPTRIDPICEVSP